MDDLLKEAIADAKAVRETALENAKMALEEAFTPRLQNMLSQKIQNEIEDEDDDKKEEDVDLEERDDEDDMEERSMMKAADEDPSDEDSEDESVDESEIIEIDGVKYAPIVSEEDDEDEDKMDEIDKEDDDMEEDLDLESVIKELESEIEESEDIEESEEIEEGEELDENDVSSDIGKGDNKVNKKANSSSGKGSEGKAKLKEGEDKEDEMDEDIDLDEVLKALSEEEDEDEKKDEVKELKSSLEEHRSVIETLRGKLNEVNLLNAKLLFTNKLFRKYGLNNEQKMKVVEQFDRASNLREVKLVYSTLGESFNGARKNEINESKGAASKPVASTKSEKEVITESNDLRDRFKKLANLI